MEKNNLKGWLYLLPAALFLGVFMVYPLIDVFVYSFEEGFNFASQSFFGTGTYNYAYVLRDPYFLAALKNTFILVIITVPLSTGIALLISVALSSIKTLRRFFQTVYFLPYVTNTLAVGLVFMILFRKTAYSDGLVNVIINAFGGESVDFIDGPYWAKMFVLCLYTIWIVMPFKILILTGAIASVSDTYYNAARMDGASRGRIFAKITLPMISPSLFYLVITGFIGAFKAYSYSVALFGTNLNAAGMNTIVGYIYDMLYGDGGGYPSFASAAAIILFSIVLTVTCINLMVSRKHVHYSSGGHYERNRQLFKSRKSGKNARHNPQYACIYFAFNLGSCRPFPVLLDGADLNKELQRVQLGADTQILYDLADLQKLYRRLHGGVALKIFSQYADFHRSDNGAYARRHNAGGVRICKT